MLGLEEKGVEWDEDNNVEHMWEQVKMGNGGKYKRSMWLSKSQGKKPKVCGQNKIKAAVTRKEVAWKGVLAASDEETKGRCMGVYREEKRKVKKKA